MLHRVVGEDIDFKTVFVVDLGLVKVDHGQIEQVVMNLVVNARDAMPHQGGKITLETANTELDEGYTRSHAGMIPGAYVMLSVSDSGVGMTREVQEQIFDPFFTTKEKGKGSGLGLSTVYGIVKQSGGDIYVYSEAGKGTTFKIYLPRVFEPPEELKKEVPVEKIPQGNETVLVIEDDGSVRKVTVDLLRVQGYKVLEAMGGEAALIICEKEKNPIHLILTDVVMPQMNGPQVIERLMQVRQDFKALYMSGYADEAVLHHRLLERGVSIIHKPFTVERLARKVREVLDKNLKPVV
jgi:CheY-like chemotaxis protein